MGVKILKANSEMDFDHLKLFFLQGASIWVRQFGCLRNSVIPWVLKVGHMYITSVTPV